MKAVTAWAVRNRPAMNTLMVAVMFVGAVSLTHLQRERFPEYRPDVVSISVAYPGASPEETEQSICLRIEEAIRPVVGIKKITATASEGNGSVRAELKSDVDAQHVLNEIRTAVDQISRFPATAEKPNVRLNVRFRNVIALAVLGPKRESDSKAATVGSAKRPAKRSDGRTDSSPTEAEELRHRWIVEQVREELLRLSAVSHIKEWHAKPYQIDVEIPESTLRRYGLTHADVTDAIRAANIDVPAGELHTDQADYLLRFNNRKLTGAAIAKIPVRARSEGVVLTVGELGTVHDGFADIDVFALINGRPALSLQIVRTPDQDMIAIHDQVKDWFTSAKDSGFLPAGYDFLIWDDYSRQARERLELLSENALYGLVLVFLMLTLFLDMRLAFWVAAGIPVAVLGTCGVMLLCGATLNMHSMFAFVMALGIVVDDAIVISENVFRHRQTGKPALQAAIDGTAEVAPSVISSVLTTVLAFLPLAYVTGDIGKWISVIPLALVSMLLISLVEGLLILPCHLSDLPLHGNGTKNRSPVRWLQNLVNLGVNWLIERVYLPVLRWSLRQPAIAVCGSLAMLCMTIGLYRGGFTPFVMNQKLDYEFVYTYIEYPKGTPTKIIDEATRRLEEALHRVNPGHGNGGESLIQLVYRGVGFAEQVENKRGEVYVEFKPGQTFRSEYMTSQQMIAKWREEAGEFPGAQRVVFWGLNNAPGGKPIEVSLLSSDVDQLETIASAVKNHLATYAGVHDITDSRGPGKWELQPTLKPDAPATGVRIADVARTVRGAYYGEEAMRLQRGRHEVRLVVRYPPEERRELATLDELQIPTSNNKRVAFSEVADLKIDRGYSKILRIDQQRAVTIRANVNEDEANALEIANDLRHNVLPDLLSQNPAVRARWEGQQEATRESVSSLSIGFAIAVFGMFGLLTFEFRSYIQPLLILAVIPFGFTGAVWGHWLLSQPITLFSLFGMVTLSGILANDSIVLVDFINRRRQAGASMNEALIESGRSRFRPVILTSITTVAALLPILFERNTQAQVLIPMAISIAFGLMLATLWVLVLVPIMYRLSVPLSQPPSGDPSN